MRIRSFSQVLAVLTLSVPVLLVPGAAQAWDISVGMGYLDNAFFVSSLSGGGGYTLTPTSQLVRASDEPGDTVPINWNVLDWDSVVGEWPEEQHEASEGVTFAVIYNDDPVEPGWGSAEAAVFGPVSEGDAVGAAFAYDFELTLSPFTTLVLSLSEDEPSYVYMEPEPGDDGNAFARVALYLPNAGLNDPGGSNMPLASASFSVVPGDPIVDEVPSFDMTFENPTPSPESYSLRLEGRIGVFEAPEPSTTLSLMIGAMALAVRRGPRRLAGRPNRS